MKRNLYSVIVTIFSIAIAAKSVTAQVKNPRISLHQTISTRAGVSKHFVTLNKNQQVKFNPAAARSLFELDGNSDLVLQNTETDKIGFIHYRYYQTYKGSPVENTMYIVHTKGGIITGATGSIVTQFYPKQTRDSTKPIGPGQAISIALKYMPSDKYAWQDNDMEKQLKITEKNPKATYYPIASKVWFCSDDTLNARNLRLCYKIDAYSLQPFDRQFIFVDIQTGRVLGTEARIQTTDQTGTATTAYSGVQTIHSDRTVQNSYRLHDLTKGNGIITLHGEGSHSDYTSSSPNWSLTGVDQYALDVHFGVAATWNFYKQKFNRNSIDNNGMALISWVNTPWLTDNAGWNVDKMIYGVPKNIPVTLVSIDITGHELTHGITQHTSGLIYQKESGAINESISDIMGKCVQFFTKPNDINWIVGNDMNAEFRHFADPNNSKICPQADTYEGLHWVETAGCIPTGGHPCKNDGNDRCGVHENSGIGNLMFYLLVNGGSGQNDNLNDYWVTGIGLDKAAAIIYRTETVYLTPTSQYADWWNACKAAATDLYGASSNELKQVENAWFAIGFGNLPVLNLAYLINRPNVRKSVTVYDGTDGLPKIQFQEGDSIVLRAGGCVQTGGVGKTWKRFVMPQGPNADHLYFCTVDVPGVTNGSVPLRSLKGEPDKSRPDIYTVGISKRIPPGLAASERFLKLGYIDDDYPDNGYSDHDNGTGDQCKNCGDAFMTVIIYRKVILAKRQHF